MNKEKECYCLDNLLLDDYFIRIVRENDYEKIEVFVDKYPYKKEVVRDAILLIRNIKIDERIVSQDQINKDYSKLMNSLSKKRKRRLFLHTAIATACAIVLLLIILNVERYKTPNDTLSMYALLDSVDINSEEIQIIAGSSQMNIKDSVTIRQTKHGKVLIGDEEVGDSFITNSEYLQIVVPYGKRSTITLSDGTVVWVNSGTTVIYSQLFKKDEREIFVNGEIYLEVAEDRSRPFVVHSKKMEISVLGTKFNINSFDNDGYGSVVLVEGSVEVSVDRIKNTLKPNQGLFIKGNETQVKEVDTYNYICWKEGFMKLNGESLDVIFNKLSKYYRVDFEYKQDIADEKYIGKLNLSESIESILFNLSLSTPFTYRMEGTKIYIDK